VFISRFRNDDNGIRSTNRTLPPDRGIRDARQSLVDACLIAVVPLALVAVFLLPASTKEAYMLRYGEPTLTTMYTSHIVHQSPAHLAANLAGYVKIVITAYLYCLFAGRRRLFRVSFVSYLVALPVSLSALNLVYFRHAVSYGFSGVVMGVSGC
jgi:hypothetical protein